MTIPAAFAAANDGDANLAGRVRRLVREEIYDRHILDRAVDDIAYLLMGATDPEPNDPDSEVLELWDSDGRTVPAGSSYGEDP